MRRAMRSRVRRGRTCATPATTPKTPATNDGGPAMTTARPPDPAADAGSALADRPGHDCPRCPRLVAFRAAARTEHAWWHNAPVASFGPLSSRLLIVGLAPGLRGG